MMQRCYILAFILLSCLGEGGLSLAKDSDPVSWQSGTEELAIGKAALFYLDSTRSMEREELPTDERLWVRSQEAHPRIDAFSGTIWIKIPLEVQVRETVFLEIRHTLLDFVDFTWETAEGLKVGKAGDHRPRSEWTESTRFPSFRIQGPAEGTVWIKAQSGSTLLFPLVLKSEASFYQKIQIDEVIQALYFGAILAIALYNLLVGVMTGLMVYGYYVAFLGGYSVYQAGMSGHLAFYVWPEWTAINDMTAILGMLFGMTGSIYFSGRLLEIYPQYRLQRWMQRYMPVVGLGSLFVYAIFGMTLTLQLAMLLGVLPWLCYLVWTAYVSLQGNRRLATWYIVAWAFFVLGSIFTLLRVNGLVPNNAFTVYAQQLGSAIEFILFSFAMADRIKFLQEQIQKEQALALASEVAARAADSRALAASEQALKEQRHLAEMKDQFLANTSHELRTPLNGLIGLGQVLLERGLGEERDRDDLRQIIRSGQRLHAIVSDLLDFSSLRRGQIELLREKVGLRPLLAEICDDFREAREKKNIALMDHTEELNPWVWGDREAMRTILRGIYSNAVKFTDYGEITLEAREREKTWELAISDTGLGMSPERLKNLEATFEQADGSTTRKEGGTGIGLALAVQLARKMEGELKVVSQLRLGTTVILSFQKADPLVVALSEARPVPRALAQTGTEAATRESAPRKTALSLVTKQPRQPQKKRRTRILVVDDDEVNRMVLLNFLNLGAYELDEAESGAEALRKIQEEGPFDAMLLDVMMPGMNGFEVCLALRERYDSLHLPILLLTAMQQTENIVKGFEVGANDYLIKPIQKDELFARLQTHLSMSRFNGVMRKFVPNDVISLLGYQSLEEVTLGDAVDREMSVLFADIRGFTRKLEDLPPQEAFRWLNQCYAVLGPIVRHYGGFIDKYIGDAILALFPTEADSAVEALCDMQRGIRQLGTDYWIGVGFHRGPTVIGTLGEPERYEATVLSDTVNVASRIEGVSKKFGAHVLVSEAFYATLKEPRRWHWRCLGPIGLKGRQARVVIYELLDVSEEAERKIACRSEFEEAMQAFRQGDFMQASLYFHTLVQKLPDDRVVQIFREKTEDFLQQGLSHPGYLDFESKD